MHSCPQRQNTMRAPSRTQAKSSTWSKRMQPLNPLSRHRHVRTICDRFLRHRSVYVQSSKRLSSKEENQSAPQTWQKGDKPQPKHRQRGFAHDGCCFEDQEWSAARNQEGSPRRATCGPATRCRAQRWCKRRDVKKHNRNARNTLRTRSSNTTVETRLQPGQHTWPSGG